jgi:hypothetical protein
MTKEPANPLERELYLLILGFPKRIDQMETRNEEACRELAREIVALVERHRASAR